MKCGKYSGRGNFFSLPNEIFALGLNAGELSVYCFLRRCENHRTHQCWPSIRTIGQAVHMSENTVRKYIRRLEERGLIATEPTEVITKTGEKRNGNLLLSQSHTPVNADQINKDCHGEQQVGDTLRDHVGQWQLNRFHTVYQYAFQLTHRLSDDCPQRRFHQPLGKGQTNILQNGVCGYVGQAR